jgi:hypothetical protein
MMKKTLLTSGVVMGVLVTLFLAVNPTFAIRRENQLISGNSGA